MREILLLTKEEIKYNSIKEIMEIQFENINSDSKLFHYGKSPNSFNYYLTNDKVSQRLYAFDEDEIEKLKPFDPYITDLEYHNSKTAKKLIQTIITIYNEMIVIDVDNNWMGTAEDFLKKND